MKKIITITMLLMGLCGCPEGGCTGYNTASNLSTNVVGDANTVNNNGSATIQNQNSPFGNGQPGQVGQNGNEQQVGGAGGGGGAGGAGGPGGSVNNDPNYDY